MSRTWILSLAKVNRIQFYWKIPVSSSENVRWRCSAESSIQKSIKQLSETIPKDQQPDTFLRLVGTCEVSHADGIMPSFSAQVVLEGPEEPEANEEEEVLF